MASTDPREWMFQAWIAFCAPWQFDQPRSRQFGNTLIERFPNMRSIVYDEKQGTLSFSEYTSGLLRAEVVLAPRNVSYRLTQLGSIDEWKAFNLPVFEILRDQAGIFEAKFGLLEARQSVYIPIRKAPAAGKTIRRLFGGDEFYRLVAREDECNEIAIDQEFAFRIEGRSDSRVILRIQTAGPSIPWLGPDGILVSLSVVLDADAGMSDNIGERWKESEATLLNWLSSRVHPDIIGALVKSFE
jgi:hypothetical protein